MLGPEQSEAVGPHHPGQESEAGALFHDLLKAWDMVLPATFRHDPSGGGTWCANSGARRRYDFVAVPRRCHPAVASAHVDTRIHLDINLHPDHVLTQVTVHLPSVSVRESRPQDGKPHLRIMYPSRDSLKHAELREAIQQEITMFPLPHPKWSVDEHDRLLTTLCLVLWFNHGLASSRVPRSP